MTSVSCSDQTFLIQLETALHRLVESFWDEPYRFFTESDAVAALQFWVAKWPGLAQVVQTADGFETGLLHREVSHLLSLPKERSVSAVGPASQAWTLRSGPH